MDLVLFFIKYQQISNLWEPEFMDTFLHPEKVKTAEEFRRGNASNQKYWEAQGHNGCNPYKNVSCKKTIGYFTI